MNEKCNLTKFQHNCSLSIVVRKNNGENDGDEAIIAPFHQLKPFIFF